MHESWLSVDDYVAARAGARACYVIKAARADPAAAPRAEEVISYQIPTHRLHGPLVHFAAQRNHLSFTVVSLDVIKMFRESLKAFEVSGRAIHFTPSKPLPVVLVRKLVRTRVKRRIGLAPGLGNRWARENFDRKRSNVSMQRSVSSGGGVG